MPAFGEYVYPPKNRIVFDGGKNNKFDKYLIEDSETPDAKNVIFEGRAVETRGGTSKLNTASVGTFACDGLFTRHDRTGTETMCAWFGGTMYQLATSTFSTIGSSQSIYTAGTPVMSAEYQNYVFMNNGTTPYKYDGTNFTRHGIPAPGAPASAVSNGGGVLTGTYLYKVAYVNSALVEGNVSIAGTAVAIVAGQVTVTGIPTGPASYGVLYRRLYRSSDAGVSYYRVTTLADNTTTSYTDNIASASLGVVGKTDNFEPPAYSVIKYHNDRLFVNDLSNRNYLWYSHLGEPYVFGALNFIRMGDNTSDLVQAIDVQENNIVSIGNKGINVVYMPDTTDTNWHKLVSKSPYGTKSPFGVVQYDNKLMFPAIESERLVGFSDFAGNAVDPSLSVNPVQIFASDVQSLQISPDTDDFIYSYVDKIAAIVYKNKIYFSVTKSAGSTTNNYIYVVDFGLSRLIGSKKKSWIPWTGLNAAFFTIYNNELYYATSTDTGFVYQMNKAITSDDGTAIDSYLWTKEFTGHPGHEGFTKDFRFVDLLYSKPGDYNMEVRYRVDSDQGVGNQTLINLNPGTSLWGTMKWGVDNWDAGIDASESSNSLGSLRGKRIQFKVSNNNTARHKFKLYGLNFTYNLKGRR